MNSLRGGLFVMATVLSGAVSLHSQSAPVGVVRITVDVTKQRHAINPLIYGVNFGTTKQLQTLRAPLNRQGGSAAEVYDYKSGARNAGMNWFYESSLVDRKDILQLPPEDFIALTQRAGADSMITIPLMGWVAKLGPNNSKLASFSITKYGLQKTTDEKWMPEAGNGVRLDGTAIHNDPNDAMQPDTPEREAVFVQSLVKSRRLGETRYYLLGNEPSLWHENRMDVRPIGAHASELLTKTLALSDAIHKADPNAKVVGPEEWMPVGTTDTGFDIQLRSTKGTATTDRTKETGGMDFLPWLLGKWKAAGHPVDVVTVHYYPQSNQYSDDVSEQMQLLRNRSTRALWDTGYHDIPWVPANTALIPSLRAMVDHYYYRGTPIGLTEYNWGADKHMNGATAQADVLGILGREGMTMATRWIAPPDGSPTFLAMQMYRNYDGHGGSFGDVSIAASAPNPDTVAVFAAERTADHAVTVVVINKQLHEPAPVQVSLQGMAASGMVETHTLSDGKISAASVTPYGGGVISCVLPPQSVTLLVVHTHGV
jgi:hypothetical protein